MSNQETAAGGQAAPNARPNDLDAIIRELIGQLEG